MEDEKVREQAEAAGEDVGKAAPPMDGEKMPAGLGIGRVVIYRSKTGKYDLPAMVTATVSSLDPEGVELGHVPPLSSASHVHLTVNTCGKPGTAREGNAVNKDAASGTYQEFDIPGYAGPAADLPEGEEIPPGSWRWPERV